jgi:hypothetical protein
VDQQNSETKDSGDGSGAGGGAGAGVGSGAVWGAASIAAQEKLKARLALIRFLYRYSCLFLERSQLSSLWDTMCAFGETSGNQIDNAAFELFAWWLRTLQVRFYRFYNLTVVYEWVQEDPLQLAVVILN